MTPLRRAAIAAVPALVAGLSACGGGTSPGAIPPAGASPETVARADVQALDQADRDALHGLSTPHFADRAIGWLDTWRVSA